MKKFGIFAAALFAAVAFTSCEPKPGPTPDIDNLVEDGFYAVGDACPIKSVNDADAVLAQMAQGINEVLMDKDKLSWEESDREGMWEKYIYLEGGKDFELILKEGENQTIYGADLALKDLNTEDKPQQGYFGSLKIGQKMQVPTTGLYHIVLDLNKDGKLDLTGGAQIIVVPVSWGISGDCNGWAMTVAQPDVKSAKEIVWKWENVEFSANQKFKFKDEKGWKIVLDDAGAVKAHTNLGTDSKNGGADIVVEKGAIYTIQLTYNLAKGEIANSYKYEVVKSGEASAKDYSDCEMELVGAAVAEQEGAVADPSNWNWGNVYSLGKPVVTGKVYTWQAVGVKMVAGGFKVRTVSFADQGDIKAFDNGSDQTIAAEGLYVITFVIDAVADTKTVIIAPYDPTAPITVKAKMPAGAEGPFNAWVWPTGGDGAWQTLTKEGDWYVYTAAADVKELNIIYIEGTDWSDKKWQTADLKTVVSTCWQIKDDHSVVAVPAE